jgi:hypothetical protein
MSDKDTALLEKANRLYPPGTEYITAASAGDDESIYTAIVPAYFFIENRIAVGELLGLVYCEGKWAEIIRTVGEVRKRTKDNYLIIN